MKCPDCHKIMKGSVCDCGYIASVVSMPKAQAFEVLVCQYCGEKGRKVQGKGKDDKGRTIEGYLNGEEGSRILCFDCYYKYYVNKRGFYQSGKIAEDKDQRLYLMALYYGKDMAKPYWCPICNRKIYIGEKRCFCGWEININQAMNEQCSKELWEKHKPFVDEYRYMKEKGLVKNGYDYFKQKVGNTGIGKMIVKQVEHKYTASDEAASRIAYLATTMPSEW